MTGRSPTHSFHRIDYTIAINQVIHSFLIAKIFEYFFEYFFVCSILFVQFTVINKILKVSVAKNIFYFKVNIFTGDSGCVVYWLILFRKINLVCFGSLPLPTVTVFRQKVHTVILQKDIIYTLIIIIIKNISNFNIIKFFCCKLNFPCKK